MGIGESAMIAVRDCTGVMPGEKVLIACDSERGFIGVPLYRAALELGAEAIYMEMRPRTRSGEEPPAIVAEAMLHSDVVIAPTVYSLTHTEARVRACANGARIATMPLTEGTKELIADVFSTGGMTADYFRMERQIGRLRRRLQGSRSARITTPMGTDIRVEFSGRDWHADTGLARNPGDFTNLPGGEVYVAPTGATGRLVVDGTIGDWGRADTPLELTIRDGACVGARGYRADELQALFDELGPEARHVAEFGIGMNPKARLRGILLEDEKAGNTAHLALGNDSGFGGTCRVPMHCDGVVIGPEIWIDGAKLDVSGYL